MQHIRRGRVGVRGLVLRILGRVLFAPFWPLAVLITRPGLLLVVGIPVLTFMTIAGAL